MCVVCQLPSDAGPCEAAMEQWYFNKDSQACERFMYGGCKGNANRFATEGACKAKCRELLAKKDVGQYGSWYSVTEQSTPL